MITKLDKRTGDALYGAVFKITTDDGTVVGNANGRYTTDRNGQIHLTGLATDTYIVTEVTAPEGYSLDTTPQTIKLKSGETQQIQAVLSILTDLKMVGTQSLKQRQQEVIS